tara:strand:+ start:478 stop:675 length:198 start_codon:yes stop_codon:yes gene_type:complete
METLIKRVLNKYNVKRKNISNNELAKLLVAHMTIGIDGKSGWYLNLNSGHGEHRLAKEIINEFND